MVTLDDVKIISKKVINEERGTLVQLYNDDLPFKPKREYLVSNFNSNTIRAFHKNFDEWKYFTVITGSVLFIVSDGENTKKIIISSSNPQVLLIPPEIWNGWKSLTNDTILFGMASTTLSEHKDERKPWDWFGKNIWEVENK